MLNVVGFFVVRFAFVVLIMRCSVRNGCGLGLLVGICSFNPGFQARGVRANTKNKICNAAGIHLGSENLHIFLNILAVVLLTFSLVVGVELLPLGFVGVIRVEVVLKIVSCGFGSSVLFSLLNSV